MPSSSLRPVRPAPACCSFSGIDLSAVISSISRLMAVGGSVNALVCGSMPAITSAMLEATSSYSLKSLKPNFLAMLSSWDCILGSGLSPSIFSATAPMSLCAAMKPSTCFSVSLSCLTGD